MDSPASPFDGFLDDASALREDVSVHDATADFGRRAACEVGALALRDTDLPLVRGFGGPVAATVTGGAGQVAGPVSLCGRIGLRLARLEVTLRDPGDLPGNARRVTAALDDADAQGGLGDTEVYVGLPRDAPTAGWLGAADEVSMAGQRLGLDVEDVSAATVLSWIDAALDRETPFRVSGTSRATGPGGMLHLLVATHLLFDGRPGADAALVEPDTTALLARTSPDDLVRARRWLVACVSKDVEATLAELRDLPLVSP